MLEKLSQEEQNNFKAIAELADESYDVVFEGMRSFAEKLEDASPAEADAHLLSAIKAAANLLVEGNTPGLKSIGLEVLASLDEYESYLEKYHGDKGGVSQEGRDTTDFTEMMPDSLHAAFDEYAKETGATKRASKISQSLKNKVQG